MIGPRRESLGALFMSVDWKVRLLRKSDFIDRPYDGLTIQTITISGRMTRRSRYKRHFCYKKKKKISIYS